LASFFCKKYVGHNIKKYKQIIKYIELQKISTSKDPKIGKKSKEPLTWLCGFLNSGALVSSSPVGMEHHMWMAAPSRNWWFWIFFKVAELAVAIALVASRSYKKPPIPLSVV
jgi:hypothetical protein